STTKRAGASRAVFAMGGRPVFAVGGMNGIGLMPIIRISKAKRLNLRLSDVEPGVGSTSRASHFGGVERARYAVEPRSGLADDVGRLGHRALFFLRLDHGCHHA